MIPSKTDPKWRAIATGALQVKLECLPLKIMVMRFTMDAQRNPEQRPEMIQACVDELHSFCSKFPDLVKSDLAKIFR